MLLKSWMSWVSSYMVKICYQVSSLDILWDPRSAYTTNTIILCTEYSLFSKWLYSVQSSCLGYNGLCFQNTNTQGNLVKELHPSCCSSPRSRIIQICMRKRSAEDTEDLNCQKVLEG